MIWLFLLLIFYVLAVYTTLVSLFLDGGARRCALLAPVALFLLNLPQIGFNYGLAWGGLATFISTSIFVWAALTYVPSLSRWSDRLELRLPSLMEAMTMRVEDSSLWLRIRLEETILYRWISQKRKSGK